MGSYISAIFWASYLSITPTNTAVSMSQCTILVNWELELSWPILQRGTMAFESLLHGGTTYHFTASPSKSRGDCLQLLLG